MITTYLQLFVVVLKWIIVFVAFLMLLGVLGDLKDAWYKKKRTNKHYN